MIMIKKIWIIVGWENFKVPECSIAFALLEGIVTVNIKVLGKPVFLFLTVSKQGHFP